MPYPRGSAPAVKNATPESGNAIHSRNGDKTSPILAGFRCHRRFFAAISNTWRFGKRIFYSH
ncbi:hypothetical protein, partial [Allomesorhizobium camelthorni]|uniref:hypothetical protein n=1 Tax=Allomesorhizobium camelthorni TaxID=475069 RepID=UPI001981541D